MGHALIIAWVRFQKAYLPRKRAAPLPRLKPAQADYRVFHARNLEPGIAQDVDRRAVGLDLHQGTVNRAADCPSVVCPICNRLTWIAGVQLRFERCTQGGANEHPDCGIYGPLSDMPVHDVSVLVCQNGCNLVVRPHIRYESAMDANIVVLVRKSIDVVVIDVNGDTCSMNKVAALILRIESPTNPGRFRGSIEGGIRGARLRGWSTWSSPHAQSGTEHFRQAPASRVSGFLESS